MAASRNHVSKAAWSVRVDNRLVTDMFRAESDRYNRKVGILAAILLGIFSIAFIGIFAWSLAAGASLGNEDDPSETNLYLYGALFVALTAFSAFIAVKPGAATAFRNRVAIRRLAEKFDGNALSFETGENGISVRIDGEAFDVPYAVFNGSAVVDGRPWLLTASPKEASLAYNLAGINWALRETGTLSIPVTDDVLRCDPAFIDHVLEVAAWQRGQLRK